MGKLREKIVLISWTLPWFMGCATGTVWDGADPAELADHEFGPSTLGEVSPDFMAKIRNGVRTSARPEVGEFEGCTATLVAPDVAITASHCVGHRTSTALEDYRGVQLTFRGETRNYRVIRYRSFGESAGPNDIALLGLAESVPSDFAQPAALATAVPAEGTRLTVFGFGCTRLDSDGDGQKRRATYAQGDRTQHLCPGDSGGPVFNDETGAILRINGGYSADYGDSDIYGLVPDLHDRLMEQISEWSDHEIPQEGEPPEDECAPTHDDVVVSGRFYIDEDESDRSTYTGGYGEEDSPYDGELSVLGAEPGTYEIRWCEDGRYAITGLDPGTYLVRPMVPESRRCTTANCPGRFAQAVTDGRPPIMLTMGDSIAVLGDPVLFPERVQSLFAEVTEIDNFNMAIAGSTSWEWLPGQPYFNELLMPHLEQADLIVITLGGNDVLEYVSGIGISFEIFRVTEGARDVVRQVVANVTEIVEAIREVNPDADIAYCLYADYSQATQNSTWRLVNWILGADTVSEILELARSTFPTDDPHLILVDLLGAADGLPLHEYLYDQVHFNDRGQTLYAEEIFTALGGVLTAPNPLTGGGTTPLGLRRDYGLSP